MIRYQTSDPDLRAAITAQKATWLARAEAHTAAMITKGQYDEAGPSWSEIKLAFMRLQGFKCAFCERALESEEYGPIEHDVEHFRPKKEVTVWPKQPSSISFATGAAMPGGYYWLAFNPWNYVTSCKPCNSALKANAFPIAGKRGKAGTSPENLVVEKPLLCYPLGLWDDDPEELIAFVATTAIPASSRGHKKRRGQTIIEFFDLNGREQIHRQRAEMITLLFPQLEAAASDQLARETVAAVTMSSAPHANCSRCFAKLWKSNPADARAAYDVCRRLIVSKSKH